MSRNNQNIEDPIDGERGPNPDIDNPPSSPDDPQPVPPDVGPQPPIEEPIINDDEPNPLPIGDPIPNEPTRLV